MMRFLKMTLMQDSSVIYLFTIDVMTEKEILLTISLITQMKELFKLRVMILGWPYLRTSRCNSKTNGEKSVLLSSQLQDQLLREKKESTGVLLEASAFKFGLKLKQMPARSYILVNSPLVYQRENFIILKLSMSHFS
jgi:hypothetical protein